MDGIVLDILFLIVVVSFFSLYSCFFTRLAGMCTFRFYVGGVVFCADIIASRVSTHAL